MVIIFQAAQAAHAAAAPPAHGSGRASHRGGASTNRPGEAPVAAMAGMSLESDGRGRRAPQMRYIEPRTRPVELQNKTGEINMTS